MNILTVNLLFMTLVFWIAARIYVLPRLHDFKTQDILVPILILHSTRHLGLMFLAPGAVYPGIPVQFVYPAAIGDLTAALLAMAAIPAVVRKAKYSTRMVLVFNIVGTLDLMLAITLATIYDAAPYMGAAYWIPALWVPALLVTHYITFILLKGRPANHAFNGRKSVRIQEAYEHETMKTIRSGTRIAPSKVLQNFRTDRQRKAADDVQRRKIMYRTDTKVLGNQTH